MCGLVFHTNPLEEDKNLNMQHMAGESLGTLTYFYSQRVGRIYDQLLLWLQSLSSQHETGGCSGGIHRYAQHIPKSNE